MYVCVCVFDDLNNNANCKVTADWHQNSNTVKVCRCIDNMNITWLDLSLPIEHRPQTTFLHPVLSWAATYVFLQLYLNPAGPISD